MKWQPTPVFWTRKFHEQESLVGCSSWDHTESDTTELLSTHAYWSILESMEFSRPGYWSG